MTTRKLAKFEVSSVGIGCMGFSHGYGALPPEEESIRLMRKAFDMGCTLFDTAEVYGPFVNETLVGKAVKPFRDKIVLTTKFTPCRVGDQDITDAEKLTAKGIRKALEDSLRRLGTDYIDCYYEHRVPLASRPEEVAEAMGGLIKEGKIRVTYTVQNYDILRDISGGVIGAILLDDAGTFDDPKRKKKNITNRDLYDESWPLNTCYPFVEKDTHTAKRTSAKALVMTHAYSNVVLDKVEEAVKNGVVGNENDDW